MKIKNEYIKIRIGKKELKFNNLILNTYLQSMVSSQEYFESEYWQSPFLAKCYVKFSRRLQFNAESILSVNDFDVSFDMKNNYINNAKNMNTIEYIYEPDNKEQYVGERITALGFFDENGDTCYACIDLFDYGLIIKEKENFSIIRKDNIITEATFNSNSPKITYPIHLTPFPIEWYESNPKTTIEYPYFEGTASAHLYSVGLGTNKNDMQKEIVLDDNNVEFFGDKIIFRNIFSNENLLDINEPSFRYPSNNLYPTNTENYFTHVFMKYKLYYNIYDRQGGINYQHVDTGKWYTLSMPIKETGEFDYAIKYERSDSNGI